MVHAADSGHCQSVFGWLAVYSGEETTSWQGGDPDRLLTAAAGGVSLSRWPQWFLTCDFCISIPPPVWYSRNRFFLSILMVHLRHTEFKWWAWRPFQPVLDIEFVYQYQLLSEVIMNDACNNKIVNNFSEDTVELHFLFFVVRRYNAKFNYS